MRDVNNNNNNNKTLWNVGLARRTAEVMLNYRQREHEGALGIMTRGRQLARVTLHQGDKYR